MGANPNACSNAAAGRVFHWNQPISRTTYTGSESTMVGQCFSRNTYSTAIHSTKNTPYRTTASTSKKIRFNSTIIVWT